MAGLDPAIPTGTGGSKEAVARCDGARGDGRVNPGHDVSGRTPADATLSAGWYNVYALIALAVGHHVGRKSAAPSAILLEREEVSGDDDRCGPLVRALAEGATLFRPTHPNNPSPTANAIRANVYVSGNAASSQNRARRHQ